MPPQTKEVNVDVDVDGDRNRDVAIVADGVSVEVPLPLPRPTTIPEAHEQHQEEEEVEPDDTNPLGYAPAAPDTSRDDAAPEPPLFSLFTGMKHDLRARQPYYNCRTSCFGDAATTNKDEPSKPQGYAYDDYQIRGDWSIPKHFFTVFNATIFAFVIQLIPALIFAELMDRQTDGNLATAETLLSSAIIGIMYAIGSGQPLVIMGITGPVSLLLGTSYGLAAQFNADYFPFFFWICFWAGLMHIVTAVVGLVSLVWKVTPFTTQIFELFIAITFIYSALRDLITPIHFSNSPTMEYYDQDGMRQDLAVTPALRAAGYASFLIGLVTCAVAWSLHFAETWLFFNKPVRTFFTSYNTVIAVVLATALSYIPGIDQGGAIERVNVVAPWDWQPTSDRNWIVNPLEGIGLEGIFGALIPGFMFFLLFIIDHNCASIVTQAPKFELKKPAAYHWDFFILGLTFFPCALLGLPPGNGLIPQAPLHARALCTRKHETDAYGVTREVVIYCEEQRWSGLGQALLMLVALSAFTVIAWIPSGCLFGLLLYLGMGALHGNEIWERLLLCFVPASKRPKIPIVRYVPWKTVQYWTLIQGICAVSIWAVGEFASVGYIYPALLTALVPLRSYLLERVFPAKNIQHLDPQEESNEEFHDEQIMIHHAFASGGGVDEEEMAFPTRAEFRGQGIKRALMNTKRRHSIGPGQTGHHDDILAIEVAKACIDLNLDDATKESMVVQRSNAANNKNKTKHKSNIVIIPVPLTESSRMKASKSITDLMELNNLGASKRL